jgi:nickel transport protein
MGILIRVFICIFFLFSGSLSFAHRVNVYATKSGDWIEGEGGFGKGSPCKDCNVSLQDEQGNVLAQGKTSEKGAFKVQLPKDFKGNVVKVVLDAGPGHRGEWDVFLGEGTKKVGSEEDKQAVASMASKEERLEGLKEETLRKIIKEEVKASTEPLMRELMALHERGPGITEIIGGIGYIIGVAGLWLYWRSSRRD